MTMKNGKVLKIREQVYKDASGITFQFLVREDSAFPYTILLFSDDLPFGNRQLSIDADGMIRGGGSITTGPEN